MGRIQKWILLIAPGCVFTFGDSTGQALEAGTPFMLCYPASVYGAHDRNFDVVGDGSGNVCFANLEGLLHYNGCEWKLITTPGISRITALYADSCGEIWVGGYNVAGKLNKTIHGELYFHSYISDADENKQILGEVVAIRSLPEGILFVAREALVVVQKDSVKVVQVAEKLATAFCLGDKLIIQSESGDTYFFDDTELLLCPVFSSGWPSGEICTAICEYGEGNYLAGCGSGMFLIDRRGGAGCNYLSGIPVNDIWQLQDGSFAVATATNGIILLDYNLKVIGHVDESTGTGCNNVSRLWPDNKGGVWCASGKGIFLLSLPSAFSRFTEKEGLAGEVLCVERYQGILYAGTYQGTYFWNRESRRFVRLNGIDQACWQLEKDRYDRLWLATASGLYVIDHGKIVRVNSYFTMSIAFDTKDEVYTAETNGVYCNRIRDGQIIGRQKLSDKDRVSDLLFDSRENLWLQTLYGEIQRKEKGRQKFETVTSSGRLRYVKGNHIGIYNDSVLIASRDGFYCWDGNRVDSFPQLQGLVKEEWWPGLLRQQKNGRLWLTGGDGRGVVALRGGKSESEVCELLVALKEYQVRCIFPEQDEVVWLGGSFGLIRVDLRRDDPSLECHPKLYFREILVNASMYEGGYGNGATVQPQFSSAIRAIRLTFSANSEGIVSPHLFSCRLHGYDERWSDWIPVNFKEYNHLPFGDYCFEVRMKDSYGRICEPEEFRFQISYPFWLQWYAFLVYVAMFAASVVCFFRWRIRKLRIEKFCLEQIVEERTLEIRSQRDEISKKSSQLEQTLLELNRTQEDLIRQEKMATVGKLTRGLVDRLLNPLNYINNFAGLSEKLVRDFRANTDESRDEIPAVLYDESIEISDLLTDNLNKITGHGGSMVRILKAMEEMLKERKCVLVPVGINELCRRNVVLLKEYFVREINEWKIEVVFSELPEEKIIRADAGLLGKALMSVMNNGVMALVKKCRLQPFYPQLSLTLRNVGDEVEVFIEDNGIGIEASILDKIFDPFFTTRTTSEAAGVGLYLSREVVLNHQGTMEVESEKGEYTRFKIKL